ncbi:MAG TPA: DUF3277 family protein [bacterium]|nr:DUF3277 family protein [bacterium]
MGVDTKTRTYDAAKIGMTFGIHTITGLPDDSFVNIAPTGAAFSTQVGADGGVDRTNLNMFSYIVTITVKQTSPTNDALSKLHAADKLSNVGVLPLMINDSNGTSILAAPLAWIAEEPEVGNGKEAGTREWTFHTGISANFVGGNFDNTGAI